MTAADAMRIIAYLKAAFPTYTLTSETVAVYCDAIKALDAGDVMKSAQRVVATSRFFPSVAEILLPMAELQIGSTSAEDAWLEVVRAIGSLGRYRAWTFPSHLTQRAVEAIGQLNICNSNNIAVERAHFFRVYESFQDSELSHARTLALRGEPYTPRLPAARTSRGTAQLSEAVDDEQGEES